MKLFLPFRFLLVSAFLLLGLTARAQAPAWQLAVATSHYTYITGSAPDASGNVYLVGYFFESAQFGSTTLTSTGFEDAFIAKWSTASNSFVWAQRMGGTSGDQATAVAVSGANVYVAGYFSQAASFGSTTLTAFNSARNVFVTKLLSDGGVFRWAKAAGGSELDAATALAVTGSTVYVAGRFTSATASFGTTSLTNAGATGANSGDAFVAKLADAGGTAAFTWAQRAGGPDDDGATALAATGTSLYVGGNFASGAATFGSSTLVNAGASGADLFVAKLTDAGSTGSFAWAQRAGGPADDGLNSLALGSAGIYAAGRFGATASFGSSTLTSAGNDDVFVAKLTDMGTTGAFTWAQQGGGTGNDEATVVAASGQSVYVTGNFTSAVASFGTPLTNAGAGDNDAFLLKLTDAGPTGSFTWAQRAGGRKVDVSRGLAIAGATVYIAGGTDGAASFGTFTIANYGGFLAALTDAALLATSAPTPLAGVSLFPNPAAGSTTVQIPAVQGKTEATLTLTDALGRAVRTYTAGLPAAGLRHELTLSDLPSGLYALQVRVGEATTVCRLIVQ